MNGPAPRPLAGTAPAWRHRFEPAGAGTGREPGRRCPAAVLRASTEVQELRRTQCLARGSLCCMGQVASAPGASRSHDLGGVSGRACEPGALCRPLRRLPCRARLGIEDLPGPIRQEPLLGGRLCRRSTGRDPHLCRTGRVPAGRQDRRPTHPRLRPRQAIYDPLHDIPVLARKPGALRNGAPFKEWKLPPAIRRVQRKLGKMPNGDRQVAQIL